MKNISLTKVSVMVFTAITCSFLVNADDSTITKESFPEIVAVKQSDKKVEEIAFNALDKDKNGLLSQKEVGESKNQLLAQSFKKIDRNEDLLLSKEELTAFIVDANK